jgi:hypothetical protein
MHSALLHMIAQWHRNDINWSDNKAAIQLDAVHTNPGAIKHLSQHELSISSTLQCNQYIRCA